jgi:hypothetical protein
MNYLSVLKLIVQILPLIIDTVKAVEAAIPQAGQGSAKLEAAKGIIMSVTDIATDVDAKNFSAALDKAIAFVVTLLNKTGVFSK